MKLLKNASFALMFVLCVVSGTFSFISHPVWAQAIEIKPEKPTDQA